jgi:hypothetical protein
MCGYVSIVFTETQCSSKCIKLVFNVRCLKYQNAKSFAKTCSCYSDYFNYAIVLCQGYVISTILLFSLCLENETLFTTQH